MKNIIQLIREHKFTEAEDRIDSLIPLIMEKKIFEMKKAVAAKMTKSEKASSSRRKTGPTRIAHSVTASGKRRKTTRNA